MLLYPCPMMAGGEGGLWYYTLRCVSTTTSYSTRAYLQIEIQSHRVTKQSGKDQWFTNCCPGTRERDKTTLSDLIKLPSGLNLSSMQIITSAIGICTGHCKICNKCTELITHSVLCTRGCEFATMLQSYTHIKLIRVGGRIYGTPINFLN